MVSETNKSKDLIELLKKLDAAYPTATTLRLILDNHSAYISKETQRYLASRPQRFQFVFVPKHGSWLNLVEYVQQDGAQHAPGDPGAQQTGTHPANPPVFPRSQCSSGGIPMEV